jgi:hypothetical protein
MNVADIAPTRLRYSALGVRSISSIATSLIVSALGAITYPVASLRLRAVLPGSP